MRSLLLFCKSLTFFISLMSIFLFYIMEDIDSFIYLVENNYVQSNACKPLSIGNLTYIFTHFDVIHLISNLFFFVPFGYSVEKFLGPKKFVLIIILNSIAGYFLHYILYTYGIYGPFLMGLSGVVCMMMSMSMMVIISSFEKEVFARMLKIFYTILFFGSFILGDICGVIYSLHIDSRSQSAHEVHLLGNIIGVIGYFFYRNKKR